MIFPSLLPGGHLVPRPGSHPRLAAVTGLLLAGVLHVGGAPITTLFNTGVDANGQLLAAATEDPHYTLIESADPEFAGPKVFTLTAGFPVGPWLAEGPSSRWIAPRPQQGTGNAEGNYTYRTTFDLTGFDPTKARIVGKWAVDNFGVDIVLNGTSLGLVNTAGFGAFTDFLIESGFQAGTNTLDFIVSNAPTTPNPTGLRVEMTGTVEVPDEAPRFLTQPTGGIYIAGDDVTLSVTADGTAPLSYQWTRDGTPVTGATEATLNLPAITTAQEGEYVVRVSNASGATNSTPVTVTVLEPLSGLFNTGVDAERTVLDDYAEDPHYRLVTNPNDPTVTVPVVQDSTIFPIATGPWVANSDTSKWIGPLPDTTSAAGGDYAYQITVNLTGFDAATARLTGRWTSDNAAQILINDVPSGVANAGNFDTLNPFILTNLLSGTNIIEFRVNNAGAGYTGLRVDGLRGGARRRTGPADEPPRLVTQPVGGLFLTGEPLTLRVVADGTAPLSYQWSRSGSALAGETNATLSRPALVLADAGDYVVRVSNVAGVTNTAAATVTVLERVPGLFGTGVDATGAVLDDAAEDPHYFITTNADGDPRPAVVHDSTIFPIVTGPWVANTAVSKWVAPRANTVEAAGGDYVYRTTFDLTGFAPTGIVLLGSWATDNLGNDIRLNGASLGLQNTVQFGALTPFVITNGFVAGTNVLEFVLNNADPVAGYTGLRVENLRAGGRRATATGPTLGVALTPASLVLSWSAADTGFRLTSTAALGTPFADVNAPVMVEGDRNVVTLPRPAGPAFFQLQK